jgi:aminoglycoside phosphotransferase family enzyme/predicted kinase
MITEDQAAVVELLAAPDAHGGAPVEKVETHSSIVFLAGRLAWKLNRAVRYDYLDFSTADRRRAMCEAEVRLNRRTAPGLYHRVVAITREAGGRLALGGPGSAVDWVIEMSRFDQDELFDRLAARERLGLELMRPLAAAIARLHAGAARRTDHGGRAGMAWVVEGNDADFATQPAGVFDVDDWRRVGADARAAIERHGSLLESRREAGFVRECHGDLHLRNIVRLDGVPTLFDGVEFNDEISCVDVMYDLAFLLMDLWRRGLPAHANAVLNGYLADTADVEALALLPLFLSCRAAVRAKTGAASAALTVDPGRRAEHLRSAREYLTMAQRLLHPPPPHLVAIGGLSGTGKSTVARALAPMLGAAPGALSVRSDDVRKRLCGVGPLDRLGPEGYTRAMSERVYATAFQQAARIVGAGHAVIVDAVFARPEDRLEVERVAAQAGVPFTGLWLEAPLETLVGRVQARRGDPSDADAAVVRQQFAEGVGDIAWHRVNAEADRASMTAEARGVVERAASLLHGTSTAAPESRPARRSSSA